MTNKMQRIIYLFLFHVMAPTCFDNNYAIFTEHLSSSELFKRQLG
jgi:hypothetical protein